MTTPILQPPPELGAPPATAFRRKGYVLFDHAVRVTASVLLALPAAGAIRGTGVTRLPSGDRALFEPGGLMLLEALRVLKPQAGGLMTTALLTAFTLAALLVVPHAILLTSLARGERRSVSATVAEAVARLPALYSLSALGFLAKCLLFALCVTLAGFARDGVGGANERAQDLMFAAVAALGVLGWIAGGAVTDLARAACVDGRQRVRDAALAALGTLGARPLRVAACYALYTSSALVLVVAAGALVSQLDVSRPETARFAAVAVLHQLVALALAFLRAAVLAETFALVSARRLRSAADRSADSAAPVDPS